MPPAALPLAVVRREVGGDELLQRGRAQSPGPALQANPVNFAPLQLLDELRLPDRPQFAEQGGQVWSGGCSAADQVVKRRVGANEKHGLVGWKLVCEGADGCNGAVFAAGDSRSGEVGQLRRLPDSQQKGSKGEAEVERHKAEDDSRRAARAAARRPWPDEQEQRHHRHRHHGEHVFGVETGESARASGGEKNAQNPKGSPVGWPLVPEPQQGEEPESDREVTGCSQTQAQSVLCRGQDHRPWQVLDQSPLQGQYGPPLEIEAFGGKYLVRKLRPAAVEPDR